MPRAKTKFNFSELWGFIIIGIGIFIFLALISYNPNDVSYYMNPPKRPVSNLMGSVGAWTAFLLYFTLGFSGYIIPFFITLWGTLKTKKMQSKKRTDIYIFAWCLALISISGLLTLLENVFDIKPGLKLLSIGGLIGTVTVSRIAVRYFGTAGSFLVLTALSTLSLIYITDMRFFILLKWLANKLTEFGIFLLHLTKSISIYLAVNIKNILPKKKPEIRTAPSSAPAQKTKPHQEKDIPSVAQAHPASLPTPKETPAAPRQKTEKDIISSKYILPTLDLLEDAPLATQRETNEDLTKNARILESALKEFGITIEVTGIQRGPVVTMYEVVLAPGTKIGKVTALSGDIALAMRVSSVRIIAPLPGKSAIGIEVPNTKPKFVYIKEVLSTSEYQNADEKLPLALGMDVAGNPLVSDLTEMPHLLVAGTTGSGKTVCLNAIILSILYKLKPDEVKLMMVDPKMVELSVYKNLPHLLAPVVHDPKKAALCLTWVVREMERRYELFAHTGVRNIEGYNTRPESKNTGGELPSMEDGLLEIDYIKEQPGKLPYIVIVIDELADLMIIAPADVEIAIGRLAQLSRAVGIHIILATQRPSVDVLTGVIKANFSTRISFQVASKVDSRTVLDTGGADMLLGKGDMLFMPPGTSKLIRAQCTLVRDKEISKVVDFIISQRKAQFSSPQGKEAIFQKLKDLKQATEEEDPMFEDAVNVILATQQASVSVLQRKLKIGYNRAARIVDMMELRGIVGPLVDGKREILVTDFGLRSKLEPEALNAEYRVKSKE